MTDEARAARYADRITADTMDNSSSYIKIKEAYLAGLEAGRLKWHNLRKHPQDLPKRLMAVWVKTEYDDYCEGYWWPERNRWQDSDMGDGESIGAVVAWCEIPKFEE